MKKNLITVLIFALCLINLVFNILLVFVFMPSATKTNKLITEIAAVLDLELASQKNDNEFDVRMTKHRQSVAPASSLQLCLLRLKIWLLLTFPKSYDSLKKSYYRLFK